MGPLLFSTVNNNEWKLNTYLEILFACMYLFMLKKIFWKHASNHSFYFELEKNHSQGKIKKISKKNVCIWKEITIRTLSKMHSLGRILLVRAILNNAGNLNCIFSVLLSRTSFNYERPFFMPRYKGGFI